MSAARPGVRNLKVDRTNLHDYVVVWTRWDVDPLTQRPTGGLQTFRETWWSTSVDVAEELWREEYEDFPDADLLECRSVEPTERKRVVPNTTRRFTK